MKEVFNAYDDAAREGELQRLPPPRPFRGYIEWLQTQDNVQAEAYWRKVMKGFDAPTPLPEDPDGRASGDGRVQEEADFLLDEEFTEQLNVRARSLRITLNSLIRGAWAFLLSRYSGEPEVVFGVTVAGRPPLLEGIESMVGLFINTLPVRFHLRPGDSLASWLSDIHQSQADLDQYAYSSLIDIQKWSDIPAGTPLFNTLLVFENYPVDRSFDRQPGGLRMRDVRTFDQTNYPLTLTAVPGRRMLVRLTYDGERFGRATAERILKHLCALLEAFAQDPSRRLSEVCLLSDAERRQLLRAFNDTAVAFDPSDPFIRRFERNASRFATRVAASCGGRSLTYGELNAGANRLARRLLSLCPDLYADDLVAVLMRRSERMMLSILAVWKCGAAYVPLDASDPLERLRDLVAESRPRLILIEAGLLSEESEAELSLIAPLVHVGEAEKDAEGSDLCRPMAAADLAYVIYTSGSTGRPKGVMVEQRGMLNHLLSKVEELGLTDESVLAHTASHCFDISVWQFFAAALTGARVHIYPEEAVLEPERLLEALEEERVTVLEVVPSYLDVLVERLAERPSSLERLEYLLVTGETLSPALVERWFALSDVPMVNAYGPTEASDDITHYRMNGAAECMTVAAGRPLRNLKVYVVDEWLNLCPVGVKGEVCVGGVGVGRGYLNDPQRTAAAFVPDPFLGAPGARMYRTGDIGSWRADGNLLLHGRKDHQVKVRGHRIELGEIEVFLERHPEVSRAVVLLQEDHNRGKRLVAYVLPVMGKTPAPDHLRKFMLARVPEYMVPAAYCSLDSFPLTRQGKIDHKALREPEPEAETEGRVYVAPRNINESKLVDIWKEVLGQPRVGVTDDYFDLGGHSILAVSLMAKIEREFGKRIPLAQLFKNPTIEQLALALRGDQLHAQWEELVEIRRTGSKPPLFLMPGAGGNVIYFHPLANKLSRELPVYALQAIGLDGVTPPLTRVEEIAARNVRAMRNVSPGGPYYLAGHSFGGLVAFEMSQILRRQGLEVSMLAILDTPAPVFTPAPYYADWDDAQWLMAVASEIGTFLGEPVNVSYEELANLDPEAQLTRLAEQIRAKGPWANGTDSARLRAYLNVYKANFKTNYQPPPEVFPVPVLLFKSSESRAEDVTPAPEVEALKQDDPAWGWGSFSSRPVRTVAVPGTHLSMLLEPHVAVLAEELERYGWEVNGAS